MIKYGGKYYYDPAFVQNHLIAVVDGKFMISMQSTLTIISILTKYQAKTLMILHHLKNMVEEWI
jgi:hypothetical protein